MSETLADPPDLFDRAREIALVDIIRHPLFRVGARLRGPCEICGHSKGKRGDGCFSLNVSENRWWCFVCDKGGDVIAYVAARDGKTPREAARWLVGGVWPTPQPKVREIARPTAHLPGTADRIAQDLWAQSRAAAGTPVETYLRGRGIAGLVLDHALHHVRFHPHAWWGIDDGLRVRLPAMIARPRVWSPDDDPRGLPTGGVHVTYLAPDGRAKTDRAPAKKMWGPQTSADGRPGAVWLTDVSPEVCGARLVVGEGIETTLAAAMLVGWPSRMAATLSLGRLQGAAARDRFGRIDPDCPTADPERPPFTWPGDGEVILALDRDMAPLAVKVRKPWGGTGERVLDADGRARLCGALAAQAWRAAGACKVRLIAPAAGRDFSDELGAAHDVRAHEG